VDKSTTRQSPVDLSETQAVRGSGLVWSGLVGSVWWNVDIVQQTNRMTSLLLLRRTQASKQVTSWMIASYRDTHSMRSWRSPAKSRRLMIVRLLPCRSLQITIITHSA